MASSPYYRTPHWKALRREALERDGYHCVVAGCRHSAATSVLFVDHIKTRPNLPHPTPRDVLGNLRTLCQSHDSQVKEQRGGERRREGRLMVKGCDPSGRPLDPNHPWNAKGNRL